MHRNNILVYKSQQDAHVTRAYFIWQLFYMFRAPEDVWLWPPKHVQQLSDKINAVACASCWDLYTRILLLLFIIYLLLLITMFVRTCQIIIYY
jgi:hypothetical protein